MKIVASKRDAQGTGASRRLRRAGQVPGIVYGSSEQPVAVALDHNALYHSMRVEAFHSSILDMELDGAVQQVLLRDVQWHAYKPQVMHVDFQRVAANQAITVRIPLHFLNEESSPAIKLQSAVINHVETDLEVSCLPADLPEFINVDLGELSVDGVVHLSQLTLPRGVTAVPTPGHDDPVIVTAAVVEESKADRAADAAEAAAAASASSAAATEAPKSTKE